MKYKVLIMTMLLFTMTAVCCATGINSNQHECTYFCQFLHCVFIAVKLCVVLAPLAVPIGGFLLIMYGLDSMFNPGCHEKDRLRKAKEEEMRKQRRHDLARKITEKIAWKN